MNNSSCSLPHELMLEVLSRVPAKSIVRFRSVCKLWNSLFHDSHFVSQQLKHASKNPTTFFGYSCMDDTRQVAFYSLEIEADKVLLCNRFTVPVKRRTCSYRMINACNGLIAFYGGNSPYVANPCTRDWMAVPEFTRRRIRPFVASSRAFKSPHLGFGFCTATGKYKLVVISWRGGTSWSCEVLTLGTDRSWRSLGDAPSPVCEFEPSYANGYIYWTIHAADGPVPERILSFDVSQEKFSMIQLPRCHLEPCGVYCHLYTTVLEESLCLLDWRVHMFSDDMNHFLLPVMRIHVLKNHEDSVWMDSHRLRLRKFEVRPSNGLEIWAAAADIMLPIAIKNGKVLLYHTSKSWRLHDLHTGTSHAIHLLCLEELNYMLNQTKPFACAESIVPIDCLKN